MASHETCRACAKPAEPGTDPPLCAEHEREASALWRRDYPDKSVFACELPDQQQYRRIIIRRASW